MDYTAYFENPQSERLVEGEATLLKPRGFDDRIESLKHDLEEMVSKVDLA
jgi:hypothetical protein